MRLAREALEVLPGASDYALHLCARIAACTDVPGTIERLFLSPATRKVHALLTAEMNALGMQVRVDGAGNLRGLYAGVQQDAPVLLTGSHLDTVPDAGAFDGVLGVAVALALVRGLGGRRLRFAIEVIAFSEEEGVRFRLPFLGSRSLCGTLGAQEMARTDAAGVSLRQAIEDFGLGPFLAGGPNCGLEGGPDGGLTPGTFCFLECHIEQGPVLEALGLPVGVVTALAGQTRLELVFRGTANHAGTTPMPLRQDALAAAAAWIGDVERTATGIDGMVATVGSVQVSPGAVNVIAGSATLTLDLRHAVDAVREAGVTALLAQAQQQAARRGVTLTWRETSRQDAVTLDPRLCDQLARAVEETGSAAAAARPVHRMVSGAGHDAMILAAHVPSAMLFLRTAGGLSHHPEEAVAAEDVQAACDVLGRLLERLEAWP